MARDGEVIRRQHFCSHGDTICHLKSGYVTTKLHGRSTCGCNNNAMSSGRANIYPAAKNDPPPVNLPSVLSAGCIAQN